MIELFGTIALHPRSSVQTSPGLRTAPRLALATILSQDNRALTLFAPDCGSWGVPARGTSCRSFINPEGFEGYGFVQRGNCTVSRSFGGS